MKPDCNEQIKPSGSSEVRLLKKHGHEKEKSKAVEVVNILKAFLIIYNIWRSSCRRIQWRPWEKKVPKVWHLRVGRGR